MRVSCQSPACLWIPIAAATLLIAACGHDHDLGQAERAISGGVLERRFPAVGLLIIEGSPDNVLCSGTLIGRRTVLTAAHCADAILTSGQASFHIGADLIRNIAGDVYPWQSLTIHPEYRPSGENLPMNDLALVVLRTAPRAVPIALSVDKPMVGEAVTMVGYGTTADGATDAGVLRSAPARITEVRPRELVFSSPDRRTGSLCFGDSGGPTFATRDDQFKQIGIHSFAFTTDPHDLCGSYGVDRRVDAYADWIDETSGGDVTWEIAHRDRVPPTLAFRNLTDGATVRSDLDIEIEAQDNVGIQYVELAVRDEIFSRQFYAPYLFQVGLIPAAHNTLTARAVDTSGLISEVRLTVQAQALARGVEEGERPQVYAVPMSFSQPKKSTLGCAATSTPPKKALLILLALAAALAITRRFAPPQPSVSESSTMARPQCTQEKGAAPRLRRRGRFYGEGRPETG